MNLFRYLLTGKWLHFLNLSIMVSLILIISISNTNCKKKKLPEFTDELWRIESLEKAAKICEKLLSCSKDVTNELNPKLKNYTESQMNASECVEKFKKTNVYRLRGENPELIKQVYNGCFQKMQDLSCEDFKNGEIEKTEECKQVTRIQKL